MSERELEVDIAGLRLRNPLILAAGILGVTGPSLKRVAESGAGAVVTKSIGPEPRKGYLNPTLTETKCGYLNAMGLPNPGVENFILELEVAKQGKVPLIASVFGGSDEEFSYVGSKMEQAGADAIELNVSCPHAEIAAIGQSPDLTYRIVSAVRKRVNIPIFVKLSPNVSDIVTVAKKCEEAGADGITCINTLRAMAIDIETYSPILGNKIGGLSGPAIKPVAIRCVYEISKEVDIPVIGCGGISSWEDAIEILLAGASTIQIGTAIALRGMKVFKEICEGIRTYLNRKGHKRVKDIVGLSHRI